MNKQEVLGPEERGSKSGENPNENSAKESIG